MLLAVKPQNFDEILPNLAKYEGEKPLVVSIAAGVTFAKLEGALGADTAMIRVMPNTPLMLGEGATQLVKNAAATDKQLSELCELFNTMGVTVTFEPVSYTHLDVYKRQSRRCAAARWTPE